MLSKQSTRELLTKQQKARAHLYDGVRDSFQTENSHIVGIEDGVSRTEVRVLTTELWRLLIINSL